MFRQKSSNALDWARYTPRLATMVLLVLAGCTAIGGAPTADDFPAGRAEVVFDAGFSHIRDVYIDEPNLADLAVTGVNGLRRFEPALAAVHEDNEARLIIGGDVKAIVPIDRHAGPSAWASAITSLIVAGRQSSQPLREATTEQIYEAVFDTLVRQLDPYTRYSSAEVAREERAKRDGFGGIGISIEAHSDGARIVDTEVSQPGTMAGLHPGDRILSIDGVAIAGYPLHRITTMLRGPVGKPVGLTIRRDALSEPFSVVIRRAHIIKHTVFFRREQNFGYFRITGFNHDTAREMREAAAKARETFGAELRGLIIDVRGNPGGLLDQAVELTDLFLRDGQIISTRGRHPRSLQFFDARDGDVASGLPIAVLVDGASASAAEIVASALQDQGRAIVIGASSFGKGTVQQVLRLPNDGELVLTWARMHAPSGYVLHQLGVLPTICTSHIVNVADALKVLGENGAETIRRNLHARRTANLDNEAQRKAIKDLCPWQPRENSDLDLEIAERILGKRELYDKMLAHARPGAGS